MQIVIEWSLYVAGSFRSFLMCFDQEEGEMKKKDIAQFAGSAVVTAVGAAIGMIMMVKSGKKIDENRKRNSK